MDWQNDAFEDLGFQHIRKEIASRCLSDLAEEKALSLSPLSSLEIIQQRSHSISELSDILEFDDPFPIETISDGRDSLRTARIEHAILHAKELRSLAQTLKVSRVCASFLKSRKDQYPTLFQIVESVTAHKSLEEDIFDKIDPSGYVVDNASTRLRQLRRDILKQEAAIREQMQSLTQQFATAGMLQEDKATIRGGRLVVPVKSAYKNKIQGIVHDQSGTGQTYFIEPIAIVEGNNRLKELQIEEKEEVERILQELTQQVGEIADEMQHNQAQVVALDLIHAMARYAGEIEATPPIINTNRTVDLKDAKNPVLMQSKKVVANSIQFGGDTPVVLITGPNAGGKTVTLKTVGLLTLMGISGLHIPATEGSGVPMVDAIYVDIGDRQSLEHDLSTFSSHIQRIAGILESATDRSLVLLDELGTGTDPTEGAALARSIIEHLREKKSLMMATTHHGELKAFAHNRPGVMNAAMQFNQEDLSPTYVFQPGRPGSSYALEIAERVGLSTEVVSRAKEFLDKSKEALEDLILELEQQIDVAEKERLQAETERRKFENLKQDYERKVAKIEKKLKKSKESAAKEAQKILQDSSRKIEQAIREIKEAEASTESIKTAKKMVEEQKEKVAEIATTAEEEQSRGNGKPVDPELLETGDLVYVTQFDSVGKIADNPKDKKRVLVEVGNKRIEVPLDWLQQPSEQQRNKLSKPSESSGKTKVNLSEDGTVSNRIDIRGQRADEALASLEQFYNRALVNNLNRLEIIHGKGTGVLQQVVDDFLSRQKQVKSHRFGEIEEGGAGVTIAELE